jgi:hypothetical protein
MIINALPRARRAGLRRLAGVPESVSGITGGYQRPGGSGIRS